MAELGKLKLVAFTGPQPATPQQLRRNKLIGRLREQIALAQAQAQGLTHYGTRQRTVRNDETGERRTVTLPKRIKQWWYRGADGRITVTVRYGSRMLELAKGKSGIEIASSEQLVATLETISQAVAAGELDAQIAAAGATLKAGFVGR
jgi:hypothetical protein